MNRKERRAAAKLGQPASPQSAAMLGTAFRHHEAGSLAEAEMLYRDLLSTEPRNVAALHLLGVLLHQSGRNEEAVKLIQKAIGIDPRVPDFHFNLATVLRSMQRLPEAASAYANAIALKPEHADAHFELGNLRARQGKFAEAAASFRRAAAISPDHPGYLNNLGMALRELGRLEESEAQWRRVAALRPDFHLAHMNLGLAHKARGDLGAAEASLRQAVRLKPDDNEAALHLATVLVALGKSADALAFRDVVARALSEPWLRPLSFEPVPAAILKADPLICDGIEQTLKHWPQPVPIGILSGGRGVPALASDPLLVAILENAPLTDVALERFATALRFALLEEARRSPANAATPAPELSFYCAIARQCFINEYTFAFNAPDQAAANELRERLSSALRDGAAIAPVWLAAVASCFPLCGIHNVQTLVERPWPEPLRALLAQQITEPREEDELRRTIPALTPVDADVSRGVQEQYEENPYPRWVKTSAAPVPLPIDEFLKREFPHASFAPPAHANGIDILVAGGGTGLHPTVSARRHPGAQVLAVDISRASLAYAARKARETGIGNIRFAQADILHLADIGETFDLIESVGALHHLADPWSGWRTLVGLLRPRGFMKIALYSELARRNVVVAQRFVKDGNYQPDAEGIRLCRQAIMRQPEGSALHAVTRFSDFYTMSGCRDLIFHVQEQRTSLPQIGAFLADNGLAFIGFDIERSVRAAYARRFPDDRAMGDLKSWHVFETENPDTFISMYNMWLQKR